VQVKYDHEVRKVAALERKLASHEKEMGNQVKTIEKWEAKSGEQEQRLNDLLKTRNVLLCQLRDLRDAIPRKDKDLTEMKARLQEIDLEYGKGQCGAPLGASKGPVVSDGPRCVCLQVCSRGPTWTRRSRSRAGT
jgi:chromosome segregation ATPase